MPPTGPGTQNLQDRTAKLVDRSAQSHDYVHWGEPGECSAFNCCTRCSCSSHAVGTERALPLRLAGYRQEGLARTSIADRRYAWRETDCRVEAGEAKPRGRNLRHQPGLQRL